MTESAAGARSAPRPLAWNALDLDSAGIAERIRWARRRGYPAYLWPAVPVAAWRDGLDAVARVLTDLLDESAVTTRLALPAATDPAALGIAAFTSGTGPLLGYWVAAERLACPPEHARLLDLHLRHARSRATRLEQEGERLLELLARAGVQGVILKGAHTGSGYFPEAATRPVTDIDVLIEPHALNSVRQALNSAGYRLVLSQGHGGRTAWLPPGAPKALRSLDLTHAENPYSIDLHTTLDRNFYGVQRVSFGPVATCSARWHDRVVQVLDQPLLTAFLASHASEDLTNLTMIRLAELALVIRRDRREGRFHDDALLALLERTGTTRFVYPALELAERLVPGTITGALRKSLARAANRRLRRVVDRLTPATAQRLVGLSMEERFLWAVGLSGHARRLAYMLWPEAAGGSLRALASIYRDRLYRLLRGRVTMGGR